MLQKMILSFFILSFLVFFACSGKRIETDKKTDLTGPYLGQKLPGETPEVFALGIVSLPGRNEPSITFSPDGKLCIFYVENWPNSYALVMKYVDGKWTQPEKAWFSTTRSAGEPLFSPDGNRIYFYSNTTEGALGGSDLWYVERDKEVWKEPVNLGEPVNSKRDEYHPCVVADGSIYFTEQDGDILLCRFVNGKYQDRIVLPEPINLKIKSGDKSWGDPHVTPDESMLLFKSNRAGGFGGFDNYVCFKNPDGSWTAPKNFGEKINSAGKETSADLSPDGKYLFFGRDGDIYWVKSDFLQSLK